MSVTKADVETVTTLIWDLENERNDALARVRALEAENAALKASSGVRLRTVDAADLRAGDVVMYRDLYGYTLVSPEGDGWRVLTTTGAAGKLSADTIEKALRQQDGYHIERRRAIATPEAWTDLPTYSYRRAGEELLVCEGGTYWKSFLFGPQRAPPLRDASIRDEAKAILDDAVAPKAAKAAARYTVRASADRLFDVYRDESVFVPDLLRDDAERVAKALNAQQEQK